MNKKQKITLVTTIAIGVGVVAYGVQILGSENTLMERFPDEDPKLVVKAHRKMILRALKNDPAINACQLDEDYDRIMLDIIDALKKQ